MTDRAALREVARLTAAVKGLSESNARMRDYIERHGFGHTSWPNDPIGCDAPGPNCPGKCIARCENVDNLNNRIYDIRRLLAARDATLAEAVGLLGVVSAVLATGGSALEAHQRIGAFLLTPAAERGRARLAVVGAVGRWADYARQGGEDSLVCEERELLVVYDRLVGGDEGL